MIFISVKDNPLWRIVRKPKGTGRYSKHMSLLIKNHPQSFKERVILLLTNEFFTKSLSINSHSFYRRAEINKISYQVLVLPNCLNYNSFIFTQMKCFVLNTKLIINI